MAEPRIYVVDETTSINKIVVYLTLETLQGDADAAAEGWKIVSEVDFSKVSAENASIVTSGNGTPVEETLNVTINDATTNLSEVKFPYDEEIVLGFDTKNVDYITLNYSSGETQTFGLSEEDFANDYLSNTQLKVTAYSSKGTVTGYTVGVFGDSTEYTGYLYSTKVFAPTSEDDFTTYRTIDNGIAIVGVLFGEIQSTELLINGSDKVRSRDFKLKFSGYTGSQNFAYMFLPKMWGLQFPCTIEETGEEWTSLNDAMAFIGNAFSLSDEEFMETYPTMTFKYNVLCSTTSLFGSSKTIKEIGRQAFYADEHVNSVAYSKITIAGTIERIDAQAFFSDNHLGASQATEIILNEGIKYIEQEAFYKSAYDFVLPSTILEIGAQALSHATSLTIKATNPPTVTSDAINADVTAIYVPAGSVDTYKAAEGWSAFAEKIQAIA